MRSKNIFKFNKKSVFNRVLRIFSSQKSVLTDLLYIETSLRGERVIFQRIIDYAAHKDFTSKVNGIIRFDLVVGNSCAKLQFSSENAVLLEGVIPLSGVFRVC